MYVSQVVSAARDFSGKLSRIREGIKGIHWYPYSSLNNIAIISQIAPNDEEFIREGDRILDIGCADGDVGLLFHSLGCKTDFLDYPATNYNDCRGLKRSAELLGHEGLIIEQDIDFGFELEHDYQLVIFLGILYHLRNPALALMRLAQKCERMVLSTRIASYTPASRSHLNIREEPIAYLVDRRELNDDPTNWWIFSPEGVRRLLKRCGWDIIKSVTLGAEGRGTPDDLDERIFCYCRRTGRHSELTKHHDF